MSKESQQAPADLAPLDTGAPPPESFTWDATLKDLLAAIYQFSPELIDASHAPRCIMMYADRLQVNWQQSGVDDPAAQSTIDIYFSRRPVAPATITLVPH